VEKSLNHWIGKIGNIKRVIIPPMSIYWLWGMMWLRVLLLSPRWDARASQGNPYPQTFFSTWPTKTLVCIYTLGGRGSPSKERHRPTLQSMPWHSLMFVSQWTPVYPDMHRQLYPSITSRQLPPFWHNEHSFMSGHALLLSQSECKGRNRMHFNQH